MSEEQIEDLLEAFSQADPSIARHFGGVGSTLAISKKLCRMMGGELIVESELGKGSAWVVTPAGRTGGGYSQGGNS